MVRASTSQTQYSKAGRIKRNNMIPNQSLLHNITEVVFLAHFCEIRHIHIEAYIHTWEHVGGKMKPNYLLHYGTTYCLTSELE